MNAPHPVPFDPIQHGPSWPDPDPRLLRPILPPPPTLPLDDVLGPVAARWVRAAAEGASAPPDYVLAALLSAVGATVGNARWVAPWAGWAEPPVLWTMCIGLPSAGKSPGLKAALAPLRRAERPLREAAKAELDAFNRDAALAKLVREAWEGRVRAAIKDGKEAPPMPAEGDPGAAPHQPRLILSDATVERVGVICEAQPKGVLQHRDELAGWLLSLDARNGGGDRAFWLEAWNGDHFAVERMGRAPVTVERLSIGVLGGIQPDRLSKLLTKRKDDGLLARFLPIWPDPAPIARPTFAADDILADAAFARLLALEMPTDEAGEPNPWFVPFDEPARDLMDEWRRQVRAWEGEAAGLLVSFIGKLPGITARLALVLGLLDHAFDGAPAPEWIGVELFGRAAHLVEAYALPMARRAYADASVPEVQRKARRLLGIIRAKGWATFKPRDVNRLDRQGLGTANELAPALVALVEGEVIREIPPASGPKGGRPSRMFEVHPDLIGEVPR